MNDIVPRRTVAKYGTNAIGGFVAGIILLALKNMNFWPALIVGGAITIIGAATSRSKDDQTTGMIIGGAGVLTILGGIPLLGGIAGLLLSISGIGLLSAGIINLFRFLKGLKSRR